MTGNERALAWMAVAMLAMLSGCEPSSDAGRSIVTDSAGVQIVDNRAPVWGDEEDEAAEGEQAWRVSPAPVLSIGARDRDPAEQFFRIADVIVTPNQELAILDAGDLNLRFFDMNGSHLRTVGGEGEGPGEFRGSLSGVLAGDSIVVFDSALGRLSLFGTDGDLRGSRRLEAQLELEVPLTQYSIIGSTPPRGYIFRKTSSRGNTGLPELTTWWDAGPTLLSSHDGMITDSIGGASGMDLWGEPGRSGFLRWGSSSSGAVHADHLYLSSGHAYQVSVFDSSGRLVRIIRKAHEPVSGAAADERLLEQAAELAEEQGMPPEALSELEQQLSDRPRAEVLPALSTLAVDVRGHLWVERYRPEFGTIGFALDPAWDVFDPGGRWLGVVTLPEGFEPHHIGERLIVGVWTDELGTEHVHVYDLMRDVR